MRYSIIFIFLFIISLTSCRKDFDTIPSSGKLEFSKTTVYLDTVFTNIGSSTYMLKVYNKSNDDISISTISLAKGNTSKYRLMVDGQTGLDADNNGFGDGKIFPNVEILANDSLFVFIETTVDVASANPTDLLYTDEILFDGGSTTQQKVNLVTLIQDAVFLYPEKFSNGTYESIQVGSNPANQIYGFYLSDVDPLNGDELHFTNAKPYVIYGFAAVPPAKVLIIDAGARVHFHKDSGIIVANTGSIQVNGTVSTNALLQENEVIFEGDRLEPDFAEVPGQWFGVLMTNGSTNNSFNHITIKNASVGLYIQGQDPTTVQVKNTQIYNSSNVGILSRTGKINGENIVINNSGQYSLACTLGGSYDFKHCTFANYWTGSSRQSPTVLIDNTFFDGETLFVTDLDQANFDNCIIFGPNNIEIGLNKNGSGLFNYNINHSLIKFNDTSGQFDSNPLYTFVKTPSVYNNLVNNDPVFKNTSKNNLRIRLSSAARANGNALVTALVPIDVDGITRTTSDMGAYEHLLD